MTGLSGSESEDLGDISTDSGDRRPYSLSQSSGAVPAGDGGLAAGEEGEADLREYGKTLGVDVEEDADLLWLVHEAFIASLPPSWTEYYDEDGRVYFYNQVTKESSWSHPMDKVFKELIELVKAVRAEQPPASKARRTEAVQAHLQAVHERAMAALDGWSGPYTSDPGTYFYNAALEVSVWDNPVDEWQSELALRQQVLHRCLLLDADAAPSAGSPDGRLEGGGTGLTEAALSRLPLGLGARSLDDAAPAPVPQSPGSARSVRSFLSARSTCTARSLTPTRARSREWPRPGLEGVSKTPPSGPSASSASSPMTFRQAVTEEATRCNYTDELAQSAQKELPSTAASTAAPPAEENEGSPEKAREEAAQEVRGEQDSPGRAPGELAQAAQGEQDSPGGASDELARAARGEQDPPGRAPDELAQAAQGEQAEAPASAASSEPPAAEAASQPAVGPSPSKRPPLPGPPDRSPAAASARAAAEEGSDSDGLEFTFGRTAPVSLPKFGA